VTVNDDDELLLMTSGGKIQRIACSDMGVIGRNTQGVRIMRLAEDDSLAVIARVPRDEDADEDKSGVVAGGDPVAPAAGEQAATPEAAQAEADDAGGPEASDGSDSPDGTDA
jgi:DNA gyrase subunit A